LLEATKTVLEFIFYLGLILTAILSLVETVLRQVRRIKKQLREIFLKKE
jgi:hypothetical protein